MRWLIPGVIALAIGAPRADAHHERDYERSEEALEVEFSSLIYGSSVFRYVHSVRIDDLEHNEAGERVLARRDHTGHRVMAPTSAGNWVPVYDAIDTDRRLRKTHEPGKRGSVGLVLQDLDDLVGDSSEDDLEVQNIINDTLAAMYESIYSLKLPVCMATVVFYADLLEFPAGTVDYHDIHILGPLFGFVVTGRSATREPWEPYRRGAPHFWTLLFTRNDDVFRQLLGYYPQWDRPHESYPCPGSEWA